MRPSSFFGILAATVSSLPIPEFNDHLAQKTPDTTFRSVGNLLGGLLGGQPLLGGNLLGGILGGQPLLGGNLLGGILGGQNLLGGILGGQNLLGSILGPNLLGGLLGGQGLLGSILGGQDPCLLDTTFCVSNCAANCLRQPKTCQSCLSSCTTGDTCSADNKESYYDDEGKQEFGDDDVDVAAASRSTKVSMKSENQSNPDLPK
ncbi:hypothetical protein F5Y12DRAFT_748852 [Xylaria sp. FL1777]|nr:hypothetical protein F5Y12DRAFT_748852 [Xylaria sp. FL1777]